MIGLFFLLLAALDWAISWHVQSRLLINVWAGKCGVDLVFGLEHLGVI